MVHPDDEDEARRVIADAQRPATPEEPVVAPSGAPWRLDRDATRRVVKGVALVLLVLLIAQFVFAGIGFVSRFF